MKRPLIAATTAFTLGLEMMAAAAPASAAAPSGSTVKSIPVLDWHELDNGCDSSAPV